eukprot:jgi/Mesvir1/10315/Mv06177-RA.1
MAGLQQLFRQCAASTRFLSALPTAGRILTCTAGDLPSLLSRGLASAAASSAQPAAQADAAGGRVADASTPSGDCASSDEAAGPLPSVDLTDYLRSCKVVPPKPASVYRDVILNLKDDQNKLGLPLWDVYHYMLAEGGRPSFVVYEALLLRATRALMLEDSLRVLDEMSSRGFQPTLNMYNRVLVLCARKKEVEKAHQTWNNLLKSGLRPSRESVRALLEVCGSTGDIRSTQEVMDWMQKMLKLPAIESMFAHQMLVRAHVLSVPRLPHYVTEVHALWDAAKVIPQKLAEAGDDSDLLEKRFFRGNKLHHALEYLALETIRACIAFKNLDVAYEIAKEAGELLSEKGFEMETIWRLEVKAGNYEKAKEIFAEMKACNVKPSRSNLVDCAKEYLLQSNESGIQGAANLLSFLAETDRSASLGEVDTSALAGAIFRYSDDDI